MEKPETAGQDTLKFCSVSEIGELYKRDASINVVVWGTGEVAKTVFQTLEAFNVPVDYFGDNTKYAQGHRLFDKPVLGASQVAALAKPFVVIGSFVFRPIWEQLCDLGVRNVCALLDSVKYPVIELLNERRQLKTYFDSYEERRSNDVLVEAYGNIGDVILKVRIFRYLLCYFGMDRMVFLVESDDIACFLRMLGCDAIVLDPERARTDVDYRYEALVQLNGRYFRTVYILGDIRLHATRRYLNTYNLNVPDIRFHTALPKDDYLLQLDIDFIRSELSIEASVNLFAKNGMTIEDFKDRFPYVLPQKYVAIHMGASQAIRRYPPRRFAKVADYIISRGYTLCLLGQGEYDVCFESQLRQEMRTDANMVSFISKLSLAESMYVIAGADFFVGTDSSMWHASYILGKRSVVIYGGGEYGCFMHRDEGVHYAMTRDHSCFGCKWYCTRLSVDGLPKCLDDIRPETVIEKVKETIDDV
jgi:hypothetical protein